jgi:tRNA(Ile)-lysidine synthase
MPHLLPAFQAYLKQAYLLQPHYHFLVAVSGGVDSVVLCELCHQAAVPFSMAHCNFQLRGAESDRDESFVKNLGERYGVPVHVKKFNTAGYGVLKKLSVQEAARELRYDWFEAIRLETNSTYVLLAHHASDNMEWMLMNLFRGTGLHGLTGMPQQADRARCLRPLLQHTRREIEQFARDNNLQWIEDSSNASSKYTRNFFRNELIPAIKMVYPQVEENLLHTMTRLQKTERLYKTLVDDVLKKLLVQNGAEWKVPINRLLQYADTALPYEVFKKFDFSEKQLPEILKLAESQSGSYMQSSTSRLIKHRRWFIITPVRSAAAVTAVVEKECKSVLLADAEITLEIIEKVHYQLNKSPAAAQLDASLVSFPLLVRRWKEGDYFYPLGMRKKKKLARFFIDLKLSLPEKEAIWVVESGSRIVWVVGYRIDDRFKITDHTKTILQLAVTFVS